MSSEIPKDNSLRGKDKIIQICEILGADTYYNAVGGKNLYDQEEFREHGITLNFVDSLPRYTLSCILENFLRLVNG